MIQIQGVQKQYGSRVLFEGADAKIDTRSRIALVGPNGAGKSTLIKMILGQEPPDRGMVTFPKGLAIGYLAQDVPKLPNLTVLGSVVALEGRRKELQDERVRLEGLFANISEPREDDLDRYGRILEEIESLDEYRLEARAKAVLGGVGFREKDWHRSLTEFSGGWLMRVALAKILVSDPDLLLLDEPTNHLDLESLLWLEDFLRGFRGAILMVSHDTEFLNRVVTSVLEIDQRRLFSYRGNIEAYRQQKAERLKVLRAQAAGQNVRIAEIERFIERFGAKATKARQAQSRMKELERIQATKIELPDEQSTMRIRFPEAPHSGKEVVTLKQAAVSYGEKRVIRPTDWVLPRGARVAIVGINGAGKTTLLRLLSGAQRPTSGDARLGHLVKPGYYAQLQAESLNLQNTILQELESVAPEMPLARVRSIAGAFLFTGDAVEKRCAVLSGGEKARVALAKLLLSPVNFLILDEPTNHLDIESRGVLLDALSEFDGTLILVSHDRSFLTSLIDTVLEMVPSKAGDGGEGSELIPFLGSYEDYLARKERELQEGKRALSGMDTQKQSGVTGKSAGPVVKEATGASNNQKRSWEKRRIAVEEEIAQLEGRQAEVSEDLSRPETYADKSRSLRLMEEQRGLVSQLEAKMAEWEDLLQKLEAAGGAPT
jgi:ATP-binding cassette subfamily F protein 3